MLDYYCIILTCIVLERMVILKRNKLNFIYLFTVLSNEILDTAKKTLQKDKTTSFSR